MPLPQLKKQHMILIGGVVLLLIALMVLNAYVQQQRMTTEETLKKKYKEAQANQTPVLVAKKDIARGQAINPDDLTAEIIPNKFVQPQAVTSVTRIAGMVTTASIVKGEQITLSKLSQQRAGGDLAAVTPAGKRALTIALDDVAAFDGMIKAGNYVDVIAIIPVPMQLAGGKSTVQMTTVPMFQNILVLAVGQDIGVYEAAGRSIKKEENAKGPNLVTLALGPQEANIVTFVLEQGSKIRLVLRSPTDARVEPTQLVTWDSLFQYIIPHEPKPKDEPPSPPPQQVVEVYRGTAKEQVPIAK